LIWRGAKRSIEQNEIYNRDAEANGCDSRTDQHLAA